MAQANAPEKSKSAAGADTPAADDMLAQLAGDEVDRMLAEAEIEATPISAAPAAAAAAPQSGGINDKELTESLDALLKEMDQKDPSPSDLPAVTADDSATRASETAPAVEAAPPIGATPDNDATAASIDSLLDEIENSESQPASSPAAAQAAVTPEANQASTPASSDIAPTSEVSEETESASARSATDAVVTPASPAAPAETGETKPASEATPVPVAPAAATSSPKPDGAPATPDPAQPASEDEGPLPLYIRLLEMLNSPLDALPDPIRPAIGKIALVTLLNAIVVIGYVLIFRRK